MHSDELDALVERARAARERAYAPYSKFAVGAALLCDDGAIVEGVNVENASYGLSMCAERSAVFAAVAGGRRAFQAIAIAGPGSTATAPCGACRQVLNEFNPSLAVAYAGPDGVVRTTLDRLLPAAFGPQSLEPHV
ncbi:MAG TPA: cytidine deaminase [Candidatus Baltobacteraceae bacterium]|jgi:cytidine deaminase|nr:cytidine deaminase [Candidatus Baltobacteraceae bacterium]